MLFAIIHAFAFMHHVTLAILSDEAAAGKIEGVLMFLEKTAFVQQFTRDLLLHNGHLVLEDYSMVVIIH